MEPLRFSLAALRFKRGLAPFGSKAEHSGSCIEKGACPRMLVCSREKDACFPGYWSAREIITPVSPNVGRFQSASGDRPFSPRSCPKASPCCRKVPVPSHNAGSKKGRPSGSPLFLINRIRHQSDMSCSLDRNSQSTLMFCTVAGNSSGKNFTSFRDISF